MAWLFKFQNSSRWWIGYRVGGKLISKTTRTADRKEAEAQLAAVNALESAGKTGSPLDSLYAALKEGMGQQVPKRSLHAEIADWVAECRKSTSPGTADRYGGVGRNFLEFLRATPEKPLLDAITSEHVRLYLAQVLNTKSVATANQERRVLRVMFRRAVANGRMKSDPVAAVKSFRRTNEAKRRPFTVEEVKTLSTKADPFWRFAVLTGFFTGLRLGDIAGMPAGAVDLKESVIRLAAQKTGSRLTIPIPRELLDVIEARIRELGRPKPEDPLWPEQAAARSGTLSNQFHNLLVSCGLAKARSHKASGKGRASERESSKISFHSLRHTFVSTLKATGSGQAIAKSLAGHSSDAVSDHYTSLPVEVLREAVNRLPSITEGTK